MHSKHHLAISMATAWHAIVAGVEACRTSLSNDSAAAACFWSGLLLWPMIGSTGAALTYQESNGRIDDCSVRLLMP